MHQEAACERRGSYRRGGVHRRDRTPAYFILAEVLHEVSLQRLGVVFHAKNIYNEIKSIDARARKRAAAAVSTFRDYNRGKVHRV